MKQWIVGIGLAACAGLSFAAPASDASIEALLSAVKAEGMMQAMYASVEQSARESLWRTLADGTPTPAQRAAVEAALPKVMAVVREELSWAKFKPGVMQVYRETFDESEVNGLIAFYRSPVGRAYVAKMPVAMQKSMALGQSRMEAALPRLDGVLSQIADELRQRPGLR